ncbi:MAG: HAD hydrolase family protein [Candidatus Heimdallarchaeota archaeon]|nr:HAD hydrolase family protein [Candidatus Heimdallarchaeota archaeon]
MIAFFDLEGPLCPIDHAADALAEIGKKLGKKDDFYRLFEMVSLYDDELFLVDKKEDYWPGDTLKLIAPLIVAYADEEMLFDISRRAEPTVGAVELFEYLHQNEITTYIISTSYTYHAYTIAAKLNHPEGKVRCTTLDFMLKPSSVNTLDQLFDDIFPRYVTGGLKEVKKDLDKFFFEIIPKSEFGPIFNSTIVCGGGRKRANVIELLEKHNKIASEAIAIGDSITDIQMLEFIRDNGGIAISFNGNTHSLNSSTIAYSGRSIYPLKKLFKAFPKTIDFVKQLTAKEKNQMATHEEFLDIIDTNSLDDFNRILELQKKYRRILRQKAAQLT